MVYILIDLLTYTYSLRMSVVGTTMETRLTLESPTLVASK